MLINHKLKAIYVHVPKTGGCYIEDILETHYEFKRFSFDERDIMDNDNPFDQEPQLVNGFFKFSLKNSKDSKNIDLSNYFVFTFVRCPYARFSSAFHYLNRMHGKYIKYIPRKCFTFNSYVQDLLDDKLSTFDYYHIMTTQKQHVENLNNIVDVDFIGRFENLNEDLCYIIKEKLKQPILFMEYLKEDKKINSNSEKINYYDIYDENVLRFVNKISKTDFDSFGFKIANNMEELSNILKNDRITDNSTLLKKLEDKN